MSGFFFFSSGNECNNPVLFSVFFQIRCFICDYPPNWIPLVSELGWLDILQIQQWSIRCVWCVVQVLVGGAGSEEDAPTGHCTEGAGHLDRVPGWGSPQLHQPGLPQLRTHQPEPERPWAIQLWGCTGERTQNPGVVQRCIPLVGGKKSHSLCLCNKADIKAFLPSLPIPLQSLRELYGSPV